MPFHFLTMRFTCEIKRIEKRTKVTVNKFADVRPTFAKTVNTLFLAKLTENCSISPLVTKNTGLKITNLQYLTRLNNIVLSTLFIVHNQV